MKPSLLSRIAVLAFSGVLLSPCLVAQPDGDEHEHKTAVHRYKLIDLGTLGGPFSRGSVNGDGGRLLNKAGVVASYADFATPDLNAPDLCFDTDDCLLAHAAKWRNHSPIDLGALDNSYSSAAGSINDLGWSTGQSQTGVVGPDFPFGFGLHAVLWKGRHILDLDTLPGGNSSIGISVNNAGQVVGFANNGIPDPFAQNFFPSTTQMRVFFWQDGNLEDIGTLGGPDTIPGPGCNNQRSGTIVGSSYTSYTPNPSSGQPTLDPFLWDDGTMTDLGNLGGTFSFGQCANNRGEVIGDSNLPGDQNSHAFRWRNGGMKDLGTLGGANSEAIWINDTGDIAGSADLPTPNIHDAVVWRHGHIKDLGTLPGDPCSRGRAINSRGQVVGGSSDCANFLHAFVWEGSGPMRDLNKLIRPGSGLQLINAFNINDRGEILAKSFPVGTTPNDDENLGHLVLLVPCDRSDRDDWCSGREGGDAPQHAAISSPASPHADLDAASAHTFGAVGAMIMTQPGSDLSISPLCLVSGGKLTGQSLAFGGSVGGFCIPYTDAAHCRLGATAKNPGKFRCRNGYFNVDLGPTACSAPSSPAVHICAPVSGSTVSSPVLVEATSTVSGTIARMELWVDGVKKYTTLSSRQLNTTLGLGAGGHRFVVLAVNTAGQRWESAINATVK